MQDMPLLKGVRVKDFFKLATIESYRNEINFYKHNCVIQIVVKDIDVGNKAPPVFHFMSSEPQVHKRILGVASKPIALN